MCMGRIRHPSVDDVLAVHEVVVEESEETEAGVLNVGDVEYAIEFVTEGHFGSAPETLHEKAYHLLRLLVANHPFVDGNKRTALATTALFYSMNGQVFAYDEEVKNILKAFGTSANDVSKSRVQTYLERHTEPVDEGSGATFGWRFDE